MTLSDIAFLKPIGVLFTVEIPLKPTERAQKSSMFGSQLRGYLSRFLHESLHRPLPLCASENTYSSPSMPLLIRLYSFIVYITFTGKSQYSVADSVPVALLKYLNAFTIFNSP